MHLFFWSATVRFLKQFQLDSIALKEKDEWWVFTTSAGGSPDTHIQESVGE
jgi:hypothetical protein